MAQKKIPVNIRKKIGKYITSLKEDDLSIDQVLLFGSWAKGQAGKDSDIDVCIVSSDFNRIDPWEYLWNKRLETNSFYIQPIGFAPKDFVDESPIVSEVKKYGLEVS